MAYKDKDRQREANRQASKKYRDSMTDKGMTIAPNVIPKSDIGVIPKKDRITIPSTPEGDIDLVALRKMKTKRGKDIKCFEDLPADVQATINRLSENPEEKRRRTGIAIRYQHLFPGRYHTRGFNSDRSSRMGVV